MGKWVIENQKLYSLEVTRTGDRSQENQEQNPFTTEDTEEHRGKSKGKFLPLIALINTDLIGDTAEAAG